MVGSNGVKFKLVPDPFYDGCVTLYIWRDRRVWWPRWTKAGWFTSVRQAERFMEDGHKFY